MKVLITGGGGYIGKSLYYGLKDVYDVTCVTRQDFDLTVFESMNRFFQDKYFDVVIHCAVQGGSRLRVDSHRDMDVNLAMYYNLLQHKPHFNKLIHFGSGAEIHNPESPYGLSKKVIFKSISDIDNFYGIRIFAVFGKDELNTRFIKSNIKNYLKNKSIIIHQNKYMDFFYIDDLVSLVNFYILNDNLPKDIDCTYKESKSLYEIANMINHLDTHIVDIKINELELGKEYIGKFTDLNIQYIGLEQGIKNIYNDIKYDTI